jgi:hypothetical protein
MLWLRSRILGLGLLTRRLDEKGDWRLLRGEGEGWIISNGRVWMGLSTSSPFRSDD